MKVLIVTSYDVGGACLAAIRLHRGLLSQGIDSRLLTLHRSSDQVPAHYQWQPGYDLQARLLLKLKKYRLHKLHQAFKPGRALSGEFSFVETPYDITQSTHFAWADIINLHWVNEFVDAASLFSKCKSKPIVWTLHDMQAFTGGCHYSLGCNHHTDRCSPCPFLTQSNMTDLASKSLQAKLKSIQKFQPSLYITAPSAWLTSISSGSKLFSGFPHQAIANGLDIRIYRPIDKAMARNILGLPYNKKIILGVSQSLHDSRKGFKILIESLSYLKEKGETGLALVGKSNQKFEKTDGFEIYHLGVIHDERMMALAYNAADLVVIPSIEDNLPNVGIEALCCGIPVVGFHIGGMPEMITDYENGILAKKIGASYLAEALNEALQQEHVFKDKALISENAHKKYSWENQSQQFIQLFEQILDTNHPTAPQS